MSIIEGFLGDSEFQKLVSSAPLVSIDIVVKNSDGESLLGMRTSGPAKDFWFVPGGRIRKDEKIEEAFRRICDDELGGKMEIADAEFLGFFEHFYDDSSFSEKISTHYVVLAFLIIMKKPREFFPNYQHEEFRWFTEEMISSEEMVHDYSRMYFH